MATIRGRMLHGMPESALRTRPDAVALASFETFVQRVTGSGARARYVAGLARERAERRLLDGEDDESDDRERLFRVLGERPELLEIDGAAIEPDAGALPWRLAELPIALRLPWALRECGGWRECRIARLCGVARREVHAALAEADARIERGVASDVLIVGEQPMILLELRRLLAAAGHTVVGVGSTRTRALSLAALSPPDLVVVDVEHAGHESALAALRVLEGRLDTPFVVLQDAVPRDLVSDETPMPEGVRTLLKPCDPDEIRRVCVRALLFDTRTERARRRRMLRQVRL